MNVKAEQKLNKEAILALNERIETNFQTGTNVDEMKLIENVASEHKVNSLELTSMYNPIAMIHMEGLIGQWKWTPKEEEKLLLFVSILESHMTNKQIYDVFGNIVKREAGGVQQRHSQIVRRESKKENVKVQTVEPLELKGAEQEIEETSNENVHREEMQKEPVLDTSEQVEEPSTPTLIDYVVDIVDNLEAKGENVENTFHYISQIVDKLCNKQSSMSAEEERKMRNENMKLKSEKETYEFRVEQMEQVIDNQEKKSQKDRETIQELEAELYNLKTASDADKLRQLQQIRSQNYTVGKGGVVNNVVAMRG